MYVYIYDKMTKEPQHEALLTSIETRLIEFGMNGKVEKLAVFKDLERVVDQYVKKGAHTLVAVGDDTTLRAVIQATHTHDIVVGFIPLKKTEWSERLRIPAGLDACEVLSKRLIRSCALGIAKHVPVLEGCSFLATPDVWIRCDDQYTITFTENAICRMWNDSTQDIDSEHNAAQWRIDITPEKTSRFKKRPHTRSQLFASSCMIGSSTHHIPLRIDEHIELQSPCELTLHAQRISLIIGKGSL